MPLSAAQVRNLVNEASTALQALQYEFERRNVPAAKVAFPRGFLRTAAEYRHTLPNIGSEVQRRNASYALMTQDVFRWLLVRTDLRGAALSMIVKEGISIFGALCEWITKEATRGHASNRPYRQRTQNLVDRGQIDGVLKAELDWIWEIRCNEHLHEVATLEHEMYTREDYNRALRAYARLRDELVAIHGAA